MQVTWASTYEPAGINVKNTDDLIATTTELNVKYDVIKLTSMC